MNERGFTLVELLVVVSVFILLVSLTVPSYVATRPQRLLSGEANRLAGTIRQGRLFALRDAEPTYLEFIPEIDMYRLWSESGWRAYSDPINAPGEPSGRNPSIGDYDGDLDGDGDYWWGDGGDPESPSGTPEDPDVQFDATRGWYYQDTDGTYADPDVLLMPTYPGNQPIRTVSPKLRISLDSGDGSILNITRDLADSGFIAGDNVVPLEVDIRMMNFAWDPSQPLGKRNGVLSHFPLLFIQFFEDGTLATSWDTAPSSDFSDEIVTLAPGSLGAVQIHLQTRGEDYNYQSINVFDPTYGGDLGSFIGDEGDGEPPSPFNTLSIDDSISDTFGRTITVNNLSGRVIIRNFSPIELDQKFVDFGIHYL